MARAYKVILGRNLQPTARAITLTITHASKESSLLPLVVTPPPPPPPPSRIMGKIDPNMPVVVADPIVLMATLGKAVKSFSGPAVMDVAHSDRELFVVEKGRSFFW